MTETADLWPPVGFDQERFLLPPRDWRAIHAERRSTAASEAENAEK